MSNQSDIKRLNELADELETSLGEFDQLLRSTDKHLWERWKAGGKAVSDEFVSMYPSVREVMDSLGDGEGEELCERCDSPLEDGFCTDDACPFSDHEQDCDAGWVGHPDKDQSDLECTCD